MVEIGQPAPAFAGTDQDGQAVSLEGLAGTPVLLVFYPFTFTGVCEGGVVTPNNTTKIKSQPVEGGRAQMWSPGGPALAVTGQQAEIELTGIEDKTIVWAWSLDVVVLALPEQAPSDKHCGKAA